MVSGLRGVGRELGFEVHLSVQSLKSGVNFRLGSSSAAGVPATRFGERAVPWAGAPLRETPHDVSTIYKRRKTDFDHFFVRFFCGSWKRFNCKRIGQTFFWIFQKSAGKLDASVRINV